MLVVNFAKLDACDNLGDDCDKVFRRNTRCVGMISAAVTTSRIVAVIVAALVAAVWVFRSAAAASVLNCHRPRADRLGARYRSEHTDRWSRTRKRRQTSRAAVSAAGGANDRQAERPDRRFRRRCSRQHRRYVDRHFQEQRSAVQRAATTIVLRRDSGWLRLRTSGHGAVLLSE